MKKFYVYELVVVPDGIVCYVGKGSGRRMYNHRKYAIRPPSLTRPYLYRKLSELLASGKNFEPRKVFETEIEQEALAEERRRIQLYGIDNLFNSGLMSGSLVEQIQDAQRMAMSKARREYVAKLQAETGQKMPLEVRAKIGAAHKGRKQAPDHGAKVWASRRQSPDFAAQMGKAREHCRAMSEAQRGQSQSPEHVARAAAGHRGQHRTQEQRDRISDALMGRMSRHGARSAFRGVTWFAPGKKWQCRIRVDRKTRPLGYFKLEADAARAYDDAFEKHYGSRPNGTRRPSRLR